MAIKEASRPVQRAARKRKDDIVEVAADVMERIRDLQARLSDLTVKPVRDDRSRRMIQDVHRMLLDAQRDSATLLGAAVSTMADKVRSGIAEALAPVAPSKRVAERVGRSGRATKH